MENDHSFWGGSMLYGYKVPPVIEHNQDVRIGTEGSFIIMTVGSLGNEITRLDMSPKVALSIAATLERAANMLIKAGEYKEET
jgi:hypothetical protein